MGKNLEGQGGGKKATENVVDFMLAKLGKDLQEIGRDELKQFLEIVDAFAEQKYQERVDEIREEDREKIAALEIQLVQKDEVLVAQNEIIADREDHIAQLQQKNRTLEGVAETDELTQIPNRHWFVHNFDRLVSLDRRNEKPTSLIFIDLDHFKRVNDDFGHKAGDNVLKNISSILAENIRKSDVPVRWGGDEFAILCPETNSDGALVLAEKIIQKIGEEGELLLDVTASIGVTTSSDEVFQENGFSRELAVRTADSMAYLAKESGKNCVVSKEYAKWAYPNQCLIPPAQ